MSKYSGFSGCVDGSMSETRRIDVLSIDSSSSSDLPTAISLLSAGQSGGSSSDGPRSDTPIQIHHTWYHKKSDSNCVRQFSTWYTTQSCSNIQQRFILSKKVITFYHYYGIWDSRYFYLQDCIVSYNGKYYRCIKDESESHTPTDTNYWAERNFPDLSNWFDISSASPTNGIILPGDADYIEVASVSEGGLYYVDRYEKYEGMYIYYVFSYRYNNTNWAVWHYTTNSIYFNRLYMSPSPTFSYDTSTNKIQISSQFSARYLMEFYRSGYNPLGYDERRRNEFFLTTMVGVMASDEDGGGYYNINDKILTRWKKNKTYTVGIRYLDTNNQSTLYSAINDVIYQINNVMSEFGIQFNKIATSDYANTTGDITFICGSHSSLFGYTATEQNWYNGQWETDVDDDGYITGATIKIRNDGQWHCTFKSCILEEMLQSLGAGRDQIDYPDNTVHSQFIYKNKPESLPNIDADILRILYSSALDAGMTSKEVAVKVNPTNGATVVTNGQKLSFLIPGHTYNAKIYVMDSFGGFSYPIPLTISVPEKTRPSDFGWTYAKNKGGAFNLTAIEWNDFTSAINDFRDYKSLAEYTFTTAVKGQPFTAEMYRQARTAIQAISGYGTLIPYVNSGDEITAYMMNILVSELNAIP